MFDIILLSFYARLSTTAEIKIRTLEKNSGYEKVNIIVMLHSFRVEILQHILYRSIVRFHSL